MKAKGAKRVSRVFESKDDAVRYARNAAEKSGGSFFVERDARVHVIRVGSQWAVKAERTSRVGSKYEAIRVAHKLADSKNVPMVVHDASGKVDHVDQPPHFPSVIADILHLRRHL